jgi:hypothetical protein
MRAILIPTGEDDAALVGAPLTGRRDGGDKDRTRSDDLQKEDDLTSGDVDFGQTLDALSGKPIFVQKSASTSSRDIAGDRPICWTSASTPRADQAASSAVALASSTASSSADRQANLDPATGEASCAPGSTIVSF